MKCNRCEYSWVSRVSSPKACPRCKHRLEVAVAIRSPGLNAVFRFPSRDAALLFVADVRKNYPDVDYAVGVLEK
jgi:hypothetical protein